MSAPLTEIFPDEWEYMVDTYKRYFREIDGRDFPEKNILSWIEMGILFGQRIKNIGFECYTEIGCGFAVPSLTIDRQGGVNVTAFDIDMNILDYAERIKGRCHSNVTLRCMDFNYRVGGVREGEIWISEKPRSNNDFEELEIRIVEDAIASGVHLALVPSPKQNTNPGSSEYNDRCQAIAGRLCRAGYRVESQMILPNLPLKWIIGLKNKT